jgi:arsenate reductase
MKQKILFICLHNSARSQMAAALMNESCGEFFGAESAGLEPGTLNPLAVEALQEFGIDISQNKTQSVFDVWKSGKMFKYVVTVCREAEAGGCPIFAGVTARLHWPFPDPARFEGPPGEKLHRTREVRAMIQAEIDRFCQKHCGVEPA